MPALFFRTPDVTTAEFDDELAVMDLRSGAYIAFNRTAADVWKLLEEPQSLDGLTDTLAARYAIDPALCRAEVDALLAELLDMQVIGQRDA